MKTYAIIGNQYEGLYTQPWSKVQPLTKTRPAPKFKGFDSKASAQVWFDQEKASQHLTHRQYTTIYDGAFKAEPARYYIFTDGGNRNTGNHAGGHVKPTDKAAWAIAIYQGTNLTQPVYTDSHAYLGRTNNDMEVQALLNALEAAEKFTEPFTIISDSKYVLDTVTNWMYNWQRAGWKKASGPIANLASWQKIFTLVTAQADRLAFIWVKGHASSAGNQLVDQLLNTAMDEL